MAAPVAVLAAASVLPFAVAVDSAPMAVVVVGNQNRLMASQLPV